MPFAKRSLTEEELEALDWAALGIEPRRVPPKKWDWSIDADRKVMCTQLISNTGEMREGSYWYLLLVDGHPSIFEVDAFSYRTIQGTATGRATLTRSSPSEIDLAALERLASEAHAAVSYRGEALIFEKGISA